MIRRPLAPRIASAALPATFEPLESRTLMSATLVAAPAAATLPAGAATHAAAAVTTQSRTLHLTSGHYFSGDVGVLEGVRGAASDLHNLSAAIDWGDGSPATAGQFYVNRLGHIHVTGQHTYTTTGSFDVTVTVAERPDLPPGQPNPFFAIRIATIHSKAIVAAPKNSAGGVTIHEAAGAAFTAEVGTFNAIAPATGLHATITWGDGSTSAGTLKSTGGINVDVIRFEVDGSHTYAKAGTYPIHVLVTRTLPGPDSGSLQVLTSIDSTAVVSAAKALSLGGTVAGTYTLPAGVPDVGTTYKFTGAGSAGDLGRVTASGTVLTPGFVTSGHATGSLTLTNANGSVTLTLTGPTEPGTKPFPDSFGYVVASGTGAYANATGSGTIAATLTPGDPLGTFTFVLRPAS